MTANEFAYKVSSNHINITGETLVDLCGLFRSLCWLLT